MNPSLLTRLRCPHSGLPLRIEEGPNPTNSEFCLVAEDDRFAYPIVNGIPRFVPKSNYADNFGMQWNFFAKTQLDSFSGHTISADRFWNATGWSPSDLRSKWVLDVGCGSGRFAEVALSAGAYVVALDFSSAVDACWENLSHYPNLHVVQGDIFSLPFAPGSFDFVYSLGVLQHTPNVADAFSALPIMLTDKGSLCADFYWRRLQTMIHMKYLLRPITTRIDQRVLFKILQNIVPLLLPLSQAITSIPLIGKALQRLIPIADYSNSYPLSQEQLNQWALLDTFDWFAPRYDSPLTKRQVRQLFLNSGFTDIEVFHSGHLVGRSSKNSISTQ